MHVISEDDDYYKRKFKIKPFSIQVDKMSDKDIKECIQKHSIQKPKSHRRSITEDILRWATSYRAKRRNNQQKVPRSPAPIKKTIGKKCNGKCNNTDDEYYKELFHIQECEIILPTVEVGSSNRKKKLEYVYRYLTFYFWLKMCFSFIVAAFIFAIYFL